MLPSIPPVPSAPLPARYTYIKKEFLEIMNSITTQTAKPHISSEQRNKFNWFKLNTNQWNDYKAFKDLSTAQVGYWTLLTSECWRNGGFLSGDKAELAKIARTSLKKFIKDCDAVLALFVFNNNEYVHPELQDEYCKAVSRHKPKGS
jgi:hypothetical protein